MITSELRTYQVRSWSFSSGLGLDVSEHGQVSRPASMQSNTQCSWKALLSDLHLNFFQTKKFVILQSGSRILTSTAWKHQLLFINA
jgi:hypothetical protein